MNFKNSGGRQNRVEFTKKMKKDYTILLPSMLPIHFELIKNVLDGCGYKTELLKSDGADVVQTGLKYVHNDTCYPAILVIGQFIQALESGKYDSEKVALMITQTGGGCRASNYIYLLRKALKKAGFGYVPVISLNLSGLEKNSGFAITIPLLMKMLFCLLYGDCIMNLKNQVEPYEVNKGDVARTVEKWVARLSERFKGGRSTSIGVFRKNIEEIVADFAKIERASSSTIRVGVVGEIYVKYSALANNNLEDFLRSQGCEICVPGVFGFITFKVGNRIDDIRLYGGSGLKYAFCKLLSWYLLRLEKAYSDALKKYPQFRPVPTYLEARKSVDGIVGYGNKMGEGWFLTAEMIELIKSGCNNIVCAQPFGCLPNHICGKGMIRKITKNYPGANIVAIDYDSYVSKVNQENRLRLMLSIARENYRK